MKKTRLFTSFTPDKNTGKEITKCLEDKSGIRNGKFLLKIEPYNKKPDGKKPN